MSDQIVIPVSADTSQMERQIQSAASNARVSVRADLNAAGLENFTRPLGRLTGQADEFSKSMEAANARVLAFGASVGVVNAISSAFKNLVASTIEVEKSLTQISAVGGQTFSNLKEVSSGIFSIAKSTGTSFKDAAEATLEFSRQGKTLAESLQATHAALVLTRTTGLGAAESIKGLTSAVNSFTDAGLTMSEIVNKMAAVDAKFAVNSKDLIEGISRSASVAQEAGVSFDQLTALITTLQEKTGRGGAVIGNSLKTIFTRVQNPEILTDLRNLGIAVQDIGGNFLPATQILKNLAKEFEGMDANLRKSILLKVGGGFQVDKLAAVLKDLANANGTYERSLSTGLNANGEAFARVEKINQTLGTSFDNLLTSAKELGSNIGQVTFSKQFTDILQNGSSMIENINKAIFGEGKDSENQGSKLGKAILGGLGSVLSGPGFALLGGIFLKLSYDFTKFISSAGQTLLGINGKTKEEEAIQKSISSVLTNNEGIQERLLSLEGDKVAQANLLLNIYTKVAQQAEKTASLSKSLSPALYEGGLRMASGNLQVKGATSAAGGYVPNLAEAIRNERQQAPSSSQIVVDHNFPMGGGQRGTMVYNTHETRIANYNNSGGDAIIPNYPVSAADGYAPNFAKNKDPKEKLAIGGRGELAIDARKVPLAGITFAGADNYLSRAKGHNVNDKMLSNYVGSPFFDKLREYDKVVVTNVPVGNVYRFRQGLQDKEDNIKSDFVSRLNQQLRPQLISFIGSEIANLGLKPGKGLDKNLSNLKLNILGSSAAGYIFEEIIKAPTLSSSEDIARYAAQSEKAYFDIHGLSPEDAEAYGLPKQRFEYADVKLGQRELSDTLTDKFLNQAIYEGGGTKLKNAAKGYVPNFEKISDLKSRMKGSSLKGSGYLQNYYDVDNKLDKTIYNDEYQNNVKIKYSTLPKTSDEYTKQAAFVIQQVRKSGNINDPSLTKYNPYFTTNFKPEKIFNESKNSTSGTLSNIKGAIGEYDFHQQFPNFEREDNERAGIDFHDSNGNLIEVKARKRIFTKEEANAKMLAYLGNKKNLKGNGNNDKINLSNFTLSLYETYKKQNSDSYTNAAKGYIPNFAKTTADILTVNPLIGTSSLDEFVKKYISSNAGTGLTGTFGFNEEAEQLGPSLSPEAKNDFLMSMLGINWLATFNRDKQANSARSSLINTKAGSTRWEKYQKGVDVSGINTQGGMRMVPDSSNVIEGVFSGNTKELKYEELYKHADKIFADAGVSQVFNNDVVANMHAAAVRFHKDQNSGGGYGSYQYGPQTDEYKKIKAATAMLRPILTQGLIGEDKNIQALLVNPPERDKQVVGDQSKYLTLVDPSAAKFKKYLSNYLLNPDAQPFAEGSTDADKNLSKLKTTRQILDTYFSNSYSAVPVPLDNLKQARASVSGNSQLRSFFGEGVGSAFSSVEMARNSSTKQPTGIKGFWNRGLQDAQIETIKQVLSASINRGGIFPIENLDFQYRGVSEKSLDPNELHTFRNSLDLPSAANSSSSLPKSLFYGEYKRLKEQYDQQAAAQNLKYKYNRDTKGVDLVAANAAKGFIPNFAELTGQGNGMLYKDPNNYDILGTGTSGKFLAPKSGEGFGQKVFNLPRKINEDPNQKASNKILNEYHVNKSLKQFEKDEPDLFAKNAISFTDVGRLLTRNGLLAGFEREVVGGSGIDEFATSKFGKVNSKADYAFALSEALAQAGTKNIVKAYGEKNGQNSLRLDDIYAQNFKINDPMQQLLIQKINQLYKANKKTINDDYYGAVKGIPAEELNSLNSQFGIKGARSIMFDTAGYSKNAVSAAEGFTPNFADSSEVLFSGTKITKEQLKRYLASKLDQDALSYINNTAPGKLTNQLKSHYLDGALGFGGDEKSLDKFRNYTITAAKGYVPNFENGGGLKKGALQLLKELAVNSIEGFLNLPDKSIDLILEAVAQSGQSLDHLLNIGVNDLGKRREYVIERMLKKGYWSADGGQTWTNKKTGKTYSNPKTIGKIAARAADGYTPNFAAGVQEAIVREKMATGLPDSMIKVSVDNRARNDVHNPSGLIVTNKVDEPHGASDVSSKRMFEAYGNAGHGHVPNFAQTVAAGNALGQALDVNFTPIEKSNTKLETAITNLTALTRQQIATLIELNKTQLIQNSIKSVVGGNVSSKDTSVIENFLDKIRNKSATQADYKSTKELLGVSTEDFGKIMRQVLANTKVLPEKNTQTNQAAQNQTPASSQNNGTTPSGDDGKTTEKANKQIKEETKSFADLAGKLFIIQGAISFASGALGSLGQNGELAGKILNDFGQGMYALTQGGQLFDSLKRNTGVAAALKASEEGKEGGLLGNLGSARAAAATATKGSGIVGVLGAGLSQLALPLTVAYAAYQGVNALNSITKLYTDQTSKTAVAVGNLTETQKKYSIGLTEQQKAISESFVKKVGNVEASTWWDRVSFTGDLFKSAPKTDTALKSLGQEGQFNTALLQSVSQVISKGAYERYKKQEGEDKGKSLTKIQDEMVSAQIEQLKQASMVARKRTPEDLLAYTEKLNTLSITSGKGSRKLTDNEKSQRLETFIVNAPEELDLEKLDKNFKKFLEDAEKSGKSTYAVQKTLEASLGVSISYLKSELTLRQQIAQSIIDTKTSFEYSLEYQKELLTTSDKEKDSINLKLQLLQKTRDLNKEKLTIANTSFQNEISTALQSKPGGISKEDYQKFTKDYQQVTDAIQSGKSNEEVSATLNTILGSAGLSKDSEVAKQLVQDLKNQLDVKDLIFNKDQKTLIIQDQIAQQQKLKNYLITSEKEKLDNILKISEKELSIAKERSQIKRSIEDVGFERSILKMSPAQQELARGEYTPQQDYSKAINDINYRNAEAAAQTKRNLISLIQQKNPNLNDDQIAELPNQNITQLQQSVRKAYEQEAENKKPENREDYINQIKNKALANPETSLFAAAGVGFKDDIDAAGTKLKNDFLDIITKAAVKLGISQPQANTPESPSTTDTTNFRTEREIGLPANNEAKAATKTSEDSQKLLQKLNDVAIDKKSRAAIAASTVAGAPRESEILANDSRKKAEEAAAYSKQLNYTFAGGAKLAKDQMETDIAQFSSKMGKDIPNDFRDAMAGAMKGLADTTKPFKDSLLAVAQAFMQKIQDALFTNLANQITAPITGLFAAPGHASGGSIKGGSGTKDDVPAMLMGGEYVIKKSAAQKYGVSYLDSLNNGTIKKFADGGYVKPYSDFVEKDSTKYDPDAAGKSLAYGSNISGNLIFNKDGGVSKIAGYTAPANTSGKEQSDLLKAQSDYYAQNMQTGERGFYMPGTNGKGAIMGQQSLLKFATQQVNAGEFDKISTGKRAASIDIGAGSKNLSLSALKDKNNLIGQSYLESKNKAMEFYFGGVQGASQKSEQDYKEQERYKNEVAQIEQAKKTAQREMYQGLIRSFAINVAVGAISYGINTAAKGVSSARQEASQANLSSPEAQASIAEGKSNLDQGLYAYEQKTGMSGDAAAKAYNYQGAYNKLYSDAGSLSWGQAFGSLKGAYSGGTIGGENRGGLSNFFNSKGSMDFGYLGTNNGVMKWNGSNYAPMSSTEYNTKFAGGVNWGKPNAGGFYPMQYNKNSGWSAGDVSKSIAGAGRHAAGGYIAGSSGSGDNVPSMLSDGEFVISKQAASQVGYNKLNQLNSGNTKSDSSDLIATKLDELLSKLNAVGTVNITVNGSGSGSGNDTKDTNRDKMAGSSDSDQKVLAQKIKLAVIQVLSDEKRLGGMLR